MVMEGVWRFSGDRVGGGTVVMEGVWRVQW